MASNSNNEHQRMTRWVLMAVILIPITAFVVLRWPQIRDRFFVQREAEESSRTTTTDVDASTASSPIESSDSDRESVVQQSPAPENEPNGIPMAPETNEPETPDPSIANAEAAAKELQKQLEMVLQTDRLYTSKHPWARDPSLAQKVPATFGIR